MIGMIGRVLRSFLFNMIIFILGFSAGYSYVATRVHYHTTKCSYAEYIQMIHDKVDELTTMDIEYSKKQDEARVLLEQFRDKLSHDVHSECDSKLGKILIK